MPSPCSNTQTRTLTQTLELEPTERHTHTPTLTYPLKSSKCTISLIYLNLFKQKKIINRYTTTSNNNRALFLSCPLSIALFLELSRPGQLQFHLQHPRSSLTNSNRLTSAEWHSRYRLEVAEFLVKVAATNRHSHSSTPTLIPF